VLIPQLAELVMRGQLPLHRLIKQYRLDQLDQAAHDMHAGVTIKTRHRALGAAAPD